MRRAPRRRNPVRRFLAFVGRVTRWTFKVALFVGLIGGLGYGVATFASESNHFRVKWIRVEGLSGLDEATIRDGCGITQDDNLIFLNTQEIRARVQNIPYVRDCTVTCVFPDTVVLRITERQAVATVLARSRYYAVDEEGRVLEELARDAEHPGPPITAPQNIDEVVPGKPIDLPGYKDALTVWNVFSKTQAGQTLHPSEIAVQSKNEIQIFFDNAPYKLCWGRGNYEQQAMRFDLLWSAQGGKLACAEYVDLRFGRDLVCK